jgi:UTP:GlnB (protein PII) uridylyltransferase
MNTTTVNVQEEKKGAEVDVQKLGNQAVIKLVCSRTPGQVLRVLHALDECKVDLLQSNVTTVGDISVHFVTVQVSCTELPLSFSHGAKFNLCDMLTRNKEESSFFSSLHPGIGQ